MTGLYKNSSVWQSSLSILLFIQQLSRWACRSAITASACWLLCSATPNGVEQRITHNAIVGYAWRFSQPRTGLNEYMSLVLFRCARTNGGCGNPYFIYDGRRINNAYLRGEWNEWCGYFLAASFTLCETHNDASPRGLKWRRMRIFLLCETHNDACLRGLKWRRMRIFLLWRRIMMRLCAV